MAEPTGQFSLAFDDATLVWAPTWTHLAQDYPNLVTSYSIDRGRQYELDHTDVGRATVTIADVDGVLDPTNPDGPYYTLIEPLRQAAIARWNPVTDQWYTRYRGFVESYSYDFDPSQRVNRLTVTLVDLQAILSRIEMVPSAFGIDTSGTEAQGQVGFGIQTMKQRIEGVLGDAFVPIDYAVVFTGNVYLHANTYSPGESVMTVVEEAVDGEWPGVGNSYVDRLGRLQCHGRLARFDPDGTSASSGGTWVFREWDVGDGAAVAGSPSTIAQLRSFGMERGLSKIINSALATPLYIADADMPNGTPISLGGTMFADGPWVYDTASIDQYGWCSWSSQNLLTREGILDGTTDLEETQRFAQYYVANFATPRTRITTITFRSMRPTDPRAAHNWLLLSLVDIGDRVNVTLASPGGGGLISEPYFVEGVHERVRPLNANYDDVELTLDLSPQAYFTENPFPLPG